MLPAKRNKKQYNQVPQFFVYVAFNLNFGIFKYFGWFIYRGESPEFVLFEDLEGSLMFCRIHQNV